MARTGRRDCRVVHRKKNHINKRVETLQKAIRKAKKDGTAMPAHRDAQGMPIEHAADEAKPELSAAATDFLSKMRAEASDSVKQLREETAAKADGKKR